MSTATLAKQLSLTRRNVQIHISELMHENIVQAVGPHLPTRRRDGRVELSARRGGRRPNEYRINFDALPPPLPTVDATSRYVEGRSPDHPSLFPLEDRGDGQGRSPDHPWGDPRDVEGRSPDHPRGDPEIIRSSVDRTSDRTDRERTATATAVAYQSPLFIERVPALDRGSIRLTAERKRELAREPNGTNAQAVLKQAYELLAHPGEATRLLGFDTPIVWRHSSVAETCQSQGDLIEATKRRCAELRIDYGRDERVAFDVVQNQVTKAWTYWFSIGPGGPRPRDEARADRRRRSRRGPRW